MDRARCEQAAPYKQVLTHGFIVKEDGTKLSKSDGAARPLHEWIQKYGADIIRLWICSQDYRGDVPVSDKIVQNLANNYRNLRNTLRYQLGSLHDFDPVKDAIPIDQMHPLDRWALHELGELIKKVTQAFDAYEFHRAFKEYIDPFCSNTLSATYHAILKDRLYTIAPNHPCAALHKQPSLLFSPTLRASLRRWCHSPQMKPGVTPTAIATLAQQRLPSKIGPLPRKRGKTMPSHRTFML